MKKKISSEHTTYNPVAGLSKTAGKSVDAVGNIRSWPGDGCRRNNFCNTITRKLPNIKHRRQPKSTHASHPSLLRGLPHLEARSNSDPHKH